MQSTTIAVDTAKLVFEVVAVKYGTDHGSYKNPYPTRIPSFWALRMA